MLTVLAAWMWFKPLTLGPKPNAESMIVGSTIARQGKGLDRLLMEDRQVIGRWARAYMPHDAEDVLWISPDLISRWLGYLKESEGLTDRQVQNRWNVMEGSAGRNFWIVVRLAALDKQDPLDLGMDEQAETTDLNPVEIRATITDISGQRIALQQVQTTVLADVRSSDANEVIGLPWYIYSDTFKPLLPAIPPSKPNTDLGTNEAHLLFVKVAIPDTIAVGRELEVRVMSRRKNRLAHFFLTRHLPGIQSQDADRNVQRGIGSS